MLVAFLLAMLLVILLAPLLVIYATAWEGSAAELSRDQIAPSALALQQWNMGCTHTNTNTAKYNGICWKYRPLAKISRKQIILKTAASFEILAAHKYKYKYGSNTFSQIHISYIYVWVKCKPFSTRSSAQNAPSELGTDALIASSMHPSFFLICTTPYFSSW